MPNAIYNPNLCLRTTLEAAKSCGFDTSKIIFEVLEDQKINSPEKLKEVFDVYQSNGFSTAIDDFGSGYAGLRLLTDLMPNIIKIDMGLVRDIDKTRPKQAAVKGIIATAQELDISVIAEGVESLSEVEWLEEHGIELMQGYFFSKPLFVRLISPEEIFMV